MARSLSYNVLHPKHPGLIVCDISGYGDDGPYRDRKAYDLLIHSEAGSLSVTGTPDEPAKAGCSVTDTAAGMYASSSELAALLQRGRTGQGIRVDVSMLESMVEWMSYPLHYAFEGAPPPSRAVLDLCKHLRMTPADGVSVRTIMATPYRTTSDTVAKSFSGSQGIFLTNPAMLRKGS